MQIIRTVEEMRRWRRAGEGGIALVPTMGYLHEGHLSLVRAARQDAERVVVSIFVNPMQFGPHEDLGRYPRDEARDLALLEAERVDCVFAPSVEEMYPQGFDTYVIVEQLTQRLEGASRPTHFRGVTTIVLKLLNTVQPDRAYFGQKDAQQLAVIRRMVRDLDVPVQIIGMPIVREPDGLALSSRNVYLSPEQRQAALVLHRTLDAAVAMFAAGERDAAVLRRAMQDSMASESVAQVDYVSVADAETLDERSGEIASRTLFSLAARFGSTRLIDNVTLDPRES